MGGPWSGYGPDLASVGATAAPSAVQAGAVVLRGQWTVPEGASEIVVFAHGSGSSRHSPRNRFVAAGLNRAGLGTLLFDLLTKEEEIELCLAVEVEHQLVMAPDDQQRGRRHRRQSWPRQVGPAAPRDDRGDPRSSRRSRLSPVGIDRPGLGRPRRRRVTCPGAHSGDRSTGGCAAVSTATPWTVGAPCRLHHRPRSVTLVKHLVRGGSKP